MRGGHFFVAKLCKVKVNEFAIGFGPTIWKKQGKETRYSLRLIPLGGFVSMEGEEEKSDEEGSFSKASIPKRIAIIAAGGLVNIIFALLIYFLIILIITGNLHVALSNTANFFTSAIESLKLLFTGKVQINQLVGPVRYIRNGFKYKWSYRIHVYDGSNIFIFRCNKPFIFSAIRWRKNIIANNRVNTKKAIKTRVRNSNTIIRFCIINSFINICCI